ncbi:MAG TPA: CocE/NonD family hydrolase [Aggregatilineaceae bacterium]|nr:CocE/NonD family hydrolase [Aggregatilineaceae bacterium]
MTTIVIEKNIMVPMRDGVRLATDIIRLDGAGPQPVLMARTPYNKELWQIDNLPVFDIFRAAQAGYTVVVQDTRGRFASEGEFTPMFQERDDGADAIQWAAAQPWSSGAVGLFGGSYVGTTQWLPAQEHPEALQAIAPMVTFSDLYEGMQYQGGAKLLHGLEWSVIMAFETLQRRVAKGEVSLPDLASLDMNDVVTHLPLANQPFLHDLAPHYYDWLRHPLPGDYWQAGSPNSAYEQITVPALNIGGWYDVFLWGTLQNYTGMRQRGGECISPPTPTSHRRPLEPYEQLRQLPRTRVWHGSQHSCHRSDRHSPALV